MTPNQFHHANEAGIHPNTSPALRAQGSMQFAHHMPAGDTDSAAARHIPKSRVGGSFGSLNTFHGTIPPHKVLPTRGIVKNPRFRK